MALEIARTHDGEIINADSMQVYRELSILTARPGSKDLRRVPHLLYGHVAGTEAYTVERWRHEALSAIETAHRAGKVPVVAGGTGFYLSSLIGGLSPIPDIDPAVREQAAARLEEIGREAFFVELERRDAEIAVRLCANDTQRILRAWEVHEATGRPLSDWQKQPRLKPPSGLRFAIIVLEPDRAALNDRIDARFDQMLAAGALDEVRRLAARGYDPGLSMMKALGVRELITHLNGEMSLDEAAAAAKLASRQFAKRQSTWFRTQMTREKLGPAVIALERLDPLQGRQLSSFLQTRIYNILSERD